MKVIIVALRPWILLAASVLAVFWGVLAAPFHYDDFALLLDPVITSSSGWWQCFRLEQTRPLTWFSFWLNFQLSGANPAPWHAFNLALHLINALLLWTSFQALLPGRASWFAAFFFALHPIQVESVAYVYARGILLATLFCLIALRLWIAGRRWHAVAAFALALLSKEECAAFPVFLLLLHYSTGRDTKERGPIAAMLALSLAAVGRVAWMAATIPGSGAGAQSGISPKAYFLTQGVALWRYLRLIVIPTGFSFEPGLTIDTGWLAIAAWLGIAGLAFVATRYFTRAGAGFWLLSALVLIAPTSSVFPAMDLAADRRLYLPMVALSSAAGLLLRRTDYPRLLWAGAVVLGMFSYVRVDVWRSPEGLWEDAMRTAPDAVRPRVQLSRLRPPKEALDILLEAKNIAPNDPAVASELGRVYMQLQQPGEALKEFGMALAAAPRDPMAFNNRGVALLALGIREHAESDFRHALELNPCLQQARENLARLNIRVDAPCKR
ncbi:MAG: hypothetical protein ABI972_04940 [Acidobacteriota bacterium]